MHKPQTSQLIAELETETGNSISNDLKRKIVQDVGNTIEHIMKTSGLRDEFLSLSAEQINEGVKQYTKELVSGITYGEHDSRLTDLLTVAPAKAPQAQEATKEETQTLSHMLRDKENLKTFRQEVNKASKSPSAPGHKAAKWLDIQLRSSKRTEEMIALFEKIEILADPDSPNRPSGHAESNKEIDLFYKQLSRDQRSTLNKVVFAGSGIGIINPKTPAGMSRRSFISGGAAAILGITAYGKHRSAVNDFDEALTTPAKKESDAPTKEKDTDDFFGPRATDRLKSKDVQPIIKDVAQREQSAGYYAAGAAASAAYGTQQFVRRIKAVRNDDFRDKVSDILHSMDTVVEQAQQKIKESEKAR